MNDKNISPELEHDFLSAHSKLNVAIGAFISIMTIDSVFKLSEMNAFANGVFYFLVGIALISAVIFLVPLNKSSKISMSKNAWRGTFRDEFLNSVNLTAYKLSYFAVLVFASIAMFGVFNNTLINVDEVGKLMLSVCMITYGCTALYQLRTSDE